MAKESLSAVLPQLVEQNIIKEQSRAAFLTQKTPKTAIYWRKIRGGQMAPYVKGTYVIDVLNKCFGFAWDFTIKETHLGKREINVLGELAIRDYTGAVRIIKQQWGGAEIKLSKKDGQPVSIGDDRKAASTNALKKCAQMIGIGNDLADLEAPKTYTPAATVPADENEHNEYDDIADNAAREAGLDTNEPNS